MNKPQDLNPVAKQWYRESWAWFILTPLIVIVIVCSIYGTVAFRYADDRVVDNYYKEGRLINVRLDEDLLAGALTLSAELVFDHSINELAITLKNNTQVYPEAIYLEMSHASDQAQDHKLALKHVAQGHYQVELDRELQYRWYLRLRSDSKPPPIDTVDALNPADNVWRLRGEIDFSKQASVTLIADW
ncbi:MAG: hypothetical protein ACI8VC_001233 [Candidatus Endobugula sp.]|jgi:hypothetical protein